MRRYYLDHNLLLFIISNSLTTDLKLKFRKTASFMVETIFEVMKLSWYACHSFGTTYEYHTFRKYTKFYVEISHHRIIYLMRNILSYIKVRWY